MTAGPLTDPPPVPSPLSAARYCLAESRPVVQVVFLMRFLVGAVCVTSGTDNWSGPGVVLGGVAMTCAVTAAYLLNGVMDIAEDRVNGSRRPIARGALPVRVAVGVVGLLSGVALLLSAFVPGEFWLVALTLFLGYAYSVRPLAAKRRTATSAVAVITTGLSSYLAGAVSAAGEIPIGALVFCGLLALWMGFVGAVTKDLGDIAGDRAGGRRTIAVVYSERTARLFAAVSAVVLGTAGLLLGLCAELVLLAGALPLALGAGWVAARCLQPDANQARGPYRAFMVTQYAANAGLAAGLLAGG
ncbi:UbiA prenyltransferase family protein [Kitasatospora sp. NPDC057015]|uniref:UbiA prenyltransferase family protein n=1 Tax=Kitasatospora sp. NPDC057015 TaxID=3346001 RepID=UPI003629DC63